MLDIPSERQIVLAFQFFEGESRVEHPHIFGDSLPPGALHLLRGDLWITELARDRPHHLKPDRSAFHQDTIQIEQHPAQFQAAPPRDPRFASRSARSLSGSEL